MGTVRANSERKQRISTGVVFRRGDNSNSDATTNSLSALLRRVSGNSMRDLREKLRSDGDRIHRDIVEYAALSQQVMQLSKIISESVKRLPDGCGRLIRDGAIR